MSFDKLEYGTIVVDNDGQEFRVCEESNAGKGFILQALLSDDWDDVNADNFDSHYKIKAPEQP